jgi:glucose-6-phosphate isomerase
MEIENIDLTNLTPDVRKLSDMKNVIYDQEWLKTAPDSDIYYMYRNLKEDDGLKYNITVTMPKMLGQEFPKTKGHVHIGNFKEIYIVLEGEAIYLMQKTNGGVVEDVYAVKAKKGEAVIIPAGYGHVTINSSDIELKTGDWTSINCKSDYSLFEKMQGACYYYLKTGWVKNENYKSVPELRFEEPLKSIPENLDFLKG